MDKYLTKVKQVRSDQQLEFLTEVMLEHFGGMEGFIDAWIKYCDQAMENGGFAAYRCLQALTRLLQYCDENRPDPAGLSEEELQHSATIYMKRLIKDEPGLAINAAHELGWRVEPV